MEIREQNQAKQASERKGQIQEQAERLTAVTDDNQKLIAELERRLTPLLRERTPIVGKAETTKDEMGLVPFAEGMKRAVDDAMRINVALRSILERIEL